MKLLTITTANLKQIHGFYRSLNVSVNSLKTLEKLDTAEILVLETLEKLGPIKADLIRTDPNWQSWGFEKLPPIRPLVNRLLVNRVRWQGNIEIYR